MEIDFFFLTSNAKAQLGKKIKILSICSGGPCSSKAYLPTTWIHVY